ncbi:SRR1-like protein [Adelges cooleyi]|uniref:SRR1-like protein n=1 Tax=Adelges cooleyi TaxID=133065 RepID=UPI00217F9C22|nr:SRR1-like protein [Adelges cooleyi]
MPKKNRKLYSSRSQYHKKSIEDCVTTIAISDFWTNLSTSLTEILDGSNLSLILCYGLGNFMDSLQSRYQLALLLVIKKEFNVDNCLVYDPKFTDAEQVHLAEIGCDLISENEEGKRRLLPGTFVYMPHCPKQLLNNLLWANWNKDVLINSVVLCNSIDLTVTSTPDRILDKYAHYVLKIAPFAKEKQLSKHFVYEDIFNDMSLHYFPKDKLEESNNIYWERGREPVYDDEELEFITKFECLSFQN